MEMGEKEGQILQEMDDKVGKTWWVLKQNQVSSTEKQESENLWLGKKLQGNI